MPRQRNSRKLVTSVPVRYMDVKLSLYKVQRKLSSKPRARYEDVFTTQVWDLAAKELDREMKYCPSLTPRVVKLGFVVNEADFHSREVIK